MDTTGIDSLRIMIESRIEELSGGIPDRGKIAIEKTPDMMDEAQLADERDLAIHLLSRYFEEIRLLKLALARIEDGTYGFCLKCEEPIDWKRLRAVPHAALCVACQDKADRNGCREFNLQKELAGAPADE